MVLSYDGGATSPLMRVENEERPPNKQVVPSFSKEAVAISWAVWVVNALFMYLMPVYAGPLNAHFANNTCTTPTWQLMANNNITCVDGRNLTELAIARGRYNGNNEPVACGCTQGVFGEDMCPIGFRGRPWTTGNTVSNYIGTPTGTALFVVLSLGPLGIMWSYGTGSIEMLQKCGCQSDLSLRLARASLGLAQVAFFVFVLSTGCVFYVVHLPMVGVFAGLMLLHGFSLVAMAWTHGQRAPGVILAICVIVMLVCFAGFAVTGLQFQRCNIIPWLPFYSGTAPGLDCPSILKSNASFWWQASGILAAFAIAPALVTWGALF